MQRLSLVASMLVATACADTGGEALEIRQNLTPPSTTCSLAAANNAPFTSRGEISLQSPQPYILTPMIESRISATMGFEGQRTILLRGARVDLQLGPISVDDGHGNVSVLDFGDTEKQQLITAGTTKFRSPFSSPLPPNGGLSVGVFDIVPTTAFGAVIAKVGAANFASKRVHAQALATIVVYGDLDGEEVESPPFIYPVTLCNDCVVRVLGSCPLPVGTDVLPGNACNRFQDGVVDCCTAGTSLLCPATVAAE
jgi:hypothetical protein